jgi:hypothetical protein
MLIQKRLFKIKAIKNESAAGTNIIGATIVAYELA